MKCSGGDAVYVSVCVCVCVVCVSVSVWRALRL